MYIVIFTKKYYSLIALDLYFRKSKELLGFIYYLRIFKAIY